MHLFQYLGGGAGAIINIPDQTHPLEENSSLPMPLVGREDLHELLELLLVTGVLEQFSGPPEVTRDLYKSLKLCGEFSPFRFSIKQKPKR